MAFMSWRATSSKEWQLQLKRMVLQGAPRVVPSVGLFCLRGLWTSIGMDQAGLPQSFVEDNSHRRRKIERTNAAFQDGNAVESIVIPGVEILRKALRFTAKD